MPVLYMGLIFLFLFFLAQQDLQFMVVAWKQLNSHVKDVSSFEDNKKSLNPTIFSQHEIIEGHKYDYIVSNNFFTLGQIH